MKIRDIRKTFLLSFCLVLWAVAPAAQATTARMPSDDELIIGARLLVTGRVLSNATAYDLQRGLVFTYTRLRVKEWLKGQLADRTIVIKEMGGIAGTIGSTIWGSPQFTPGSDVLLYLTTWPDGSLRTYNWWLGYFNVVGGVVERSDGGANTDLLPTPTGLQVTDRAPLAEYTSMVRKHLNANRDRARKHEQDLFWNAPILVEPPNYNELKPTLQPSYTLLNPSQPVRWFEPDTHQPVVFFVNEDQRPPSASDADLTAAMG
ncbi:MAG: hypothetical protein ACREAC_01525, partial [Blastocatellia bacterium]